MKRIFALLVSAGLMVFIFMKLDLREFAQNVSQLNIGLFGAALLFFIPQIYISGYRWKLLVEHKAAMTLSEAVKLTLSACSLNILLPSKMGDFCKAYFLKKQGKVDLKRGTNIVLFERYVDLASLGIFALIGALGAGQWNFAGLVALLFALLILGLFPALYFFPFQKLSMPAVCKKSRLAEKIWFFFMDAHQYILELKSDRGGVKTLFLLSFLLWLLHLLQFYVVFLAIGSTVSLYHVFCLIPLGILAGLVPLTLAGVGTRDSALIYLFASYTDLSKIVFVGLFASARYFIPGILGIPFFNHYLVSEKVEPSEG